MERIKAAIIGTGNIGTDLLYKIKRSKYLGVGLFAGRNPDSNGIRIAKAMNIPTTLESIKAIENDPDCCEIIFDATSAEVHKENAPIFKKLNKFVVDLTPARTGKMCIPVLNLESCLNEREVNMVTCGGQATAPLAYAISRVQPNVRYFEIIATIASRSAGTGTRNNIDEFTQTTKDALTEFSGIKDSKAIIIINPAEPPITMHNTLYALIDKPDIEKITESVFSMADRIKQYVPGYEIVTSPVYENGRVTVTLQVRGRGDYLPPYSGNLDIMTCAAVELAEKYAIKKIGE